MAKQFGITALATTALVVTMALAGCTSDVETTSEHNHGMMGDARSTGSHSNATAATDSGFSGADIMFAQMMIPHHQQAVLMSNLAIKISGNPDVLALAKDIKDAQQPEIAQMKSWLAKAGAPLEMGHSMGMGGMLTDAQISTLSAATGTEFDKLFLQGMIAHHQGAIHMAQMVTDSRNAQAAALGKAIVESQTTQITYMQGLLNQ